MGSCWVVCYPLQLLQVAACLDQLARGVRGKRCCAKGVWLSCCVAWHLPQVAQIPLSCCMVCSVNAAGMLAGTETTNVAWPPFMALSLPVVQCFTVHCVACCSRCACCGNVICLGPAALFGCKPACCAALCSNTCCMLFSLCLVQVYQLPEPCSPEFLAAVAKWQHTEEKEDEEEKRREYYGLGGGSTFGLVSARPDAAAAVHWLF